MVTGGGGGVNVAVAHGYGVCRQVVPRKVGELDSIDAVRQRDSGVNVELEEAVTEDQRDVVLARQLCRGHGLFDFRADANAAKGAAVEKRPQILRVRDVVVAD